MTPFNFNDIPEDIFEQRGQFFLEGIEKRVSRSTEYIQKGYRNKNKLYECNVFMDYVYRDAFIGDLNFHGDYPIIEAHHQFDYSIKHALSGSYKAAIENLRSCLELTVLTVFYSIQKDFIRTSECNLEKYTEELLNKLKAEKDWLNSTKDTPFFSKMVSKIKKIERVDSFDKEFEWISKFLKIYYTLSDVAHIKGLKYGAYRMNQINNRINNSSYHSVNLETLNFYFDTLVDTIENIATLLSLYNPIILVELPLYEKFGDNYPIGFVHPPQARNINSIIPTQYLNYFNNLKLHDEEILSKKNWVEKRPFLNQDFRQE